MFKNILIIGCGMIGSSILRGAINQKLFWGLLATANNQEQEVQCKVQL